MAMLKALHSNRVWVKLPEKLAYIESSNWSPENCPVRSRLKGRLAEPKSMPARFRNEGRTEMPIIAQMKDVGILVTEEIGLVFLLGISRA